MANEFIRLSPELGLWTDRQGTAALTRLAFSGVDMHPYWNKLVAEISDDAKGAGLGMDLSIIAQLMGDQRTGLAIQKDSLKYQRLFRSPCASASPKLRVLALAAEMDIGGNTPLEFLLEGSDIALTTLYIVPGPPLPELIPAHDVAIVTACESDANRAMLAEIAKLVAELAAAGAQPPASDRAAVARRLCGLLRNRCPASIIPVDGASSSERR